MQRIDFQKNLLEIEFHIGENLSECEIWSDLGLTIDDYSRLGDALRACIQPGEGFKRIRKLLERYPLCMLTHAVFNIVFDYSEEFWEPWAQTFGLSFSIQQQSETGQLFLDTLKKYGYQTEYSEGYKYLTPIIAQAGVPNYCLDDLFELVDREGRHSFDPVEAVDELIHIRGCAIKRPLFRFLSTHRGRAASFLADIQDMMLSTPAGLEEELHFDRRIQERYQLWHDENAHASRRESRRRGVLSLPRLTFMDDGRGVCLVLPPFAPENEYADALIWRISQPDGAMEVKSKLYRDADLCASREMTIPIRPYPGLSLSVHDDVCPECELAGWKILGGACFYLLFSMSGKRLPEESLPLAGCYLVLCSDEVEWSASDVICEPVSLSRMAGVRCFSLCGITRISELNIWDKSVHCLRVLSNLRILLSGGEFLFSEDPAPWDGMRLYTALPNVSVESECEGESLIQIAHRQSGFKKTITLPKGEGAFLAPEAYAPEEALYGIYEVRGYESGHLKRSLAFGYTPAISYNNFDLPAWPDSSGRWSGIHFCFTPSAGAGITFDGVLSDHISAGCNGFLRDVLIDDPLPYITGRLQVGGEYPFEAPFRLTIRAIQWNFWCEQNAGKIFTGIQVIDIEKIKSERWWLDLFLSNAANDHAAIVIRGRRSGYINTLDVTAAAGGRWHVCLGDIVADIPQAALPVDVALKTADRTVRLATIQERVLLPGLRYFCGPETKERPLIMWHDAGVIAVDELSLTMVNDPDYKLQLRMGDVKRNKKDQPYLLLPRPLARGRYLIEEKWSDDDDLFFDAPAFRPPALLGENTFAVCSPTAEQMADFRVEPCAVMLLETALICPQNVGVLSEAVQAMRCLAGASAKLSSEKAMKLLITLTVHLFHAEGAAGEEIDLLAELIFLIASKSLDDETRGDLMALVLSSRLTYEERSFCFKRLNLFLSLPGSARLSGEALTLLGELNGQAALLWRLRTGQPVSSALLAAVVGLDALKAIVSFHPQPSCEDFDWYECLDRTLRGACRCATSDLPESIVGRSRDFQQMFNWEKRYGDIELLIERKPKGEMYFCGETYIDLMVRWHFEFQHRQDVAKKQRREECLRLARNLEASIPRLNQAAAFLAQAYRRALEPRKLNEGPFSIFYASALAALFNSLYARGLIEKAQYLPARDLLIQAMYVIPDLVRRDVVLAELYLLFTKGVSWMSMNPIATKQTVEEDYIAYLQSILTVRDPEINRLARAALKPSAFIKGPYLEATPPFRQGKSLSDLAEEGLISREFGQVRDDMHFLRPLYAHQEEAVRKICGEGTNVIVATGTGSGKTECYFYPIFNALMREKEKEELTPGVRALLLFPMNALANDQLKKLRQLLRNYKWITFGRYTGETPDCPEVEARRAFRQRNDEEALENEMLSRERMRDEPPHILLTNYAMLEYLLLRPNDSSLFDGHYAGNWKFIVLDEAHTYRGSNGSEIAMLMRRLKQRIMRNNAAAPLCIATSATLGSESAKQSLAEFATSIFGEQFIPENIITSKRAELVKGPSPRPYMPKEYADIRENLGGLEESKRQTEAYRRLMNDERIATLHEVLAERPTELAEAADKVFSDLSNREERANALVSLIELATIAKPRENSAGLLSARYHLFIRSLEGMFASFYPRKQVYLDRREQAIVDGKTVKVFELANCERCHQEYIIGKIQNNALQPVSEIDKPDYFLVADGMQDERFNIDDEDEDDESGANCERFTLCTCCGHIQPSKQQGDSCCEMADSSKLITVYRVLRGNRSGAKSDACLMCGGVDEGILRRFLTANHAATFVASDSLYSMIPPKPISPDQAAEDDLFADIPRINPEYTQESGRKLLIFSDNRQEAAYFAGFLEKRHQQIAWRRLMIRVLKRHPDGLNVNDLMDELTLEADRSGLFDEQEVDSRIQKQKLAQMYAMREFLAVDRATGLEGRGYIEVFPEPKPLKNGRWGGDTGEAWRLIRYCMDTLRQAGAVVYPDSVPATDEFFEPRNHEVFFRAEQRQKYYGKEILAFLPNESRSNKRLAYVQKFLKAHNQNADRSAAMDVLRDILDVLLRLGETGYLYRQSNALPATCQALNYRKWRMRFIEDREHVFRCNRCGRVFAYEIGGICPELRCEGRLIRTSVGDVRNDPYYERLFHDTKVLPMKVREHTAQLSKEAAGDYQRDFEAGKINVLSCSTTFEMGVDVGDLEATFLRNVPPETANYIQRAGRAGRRTSSTAFAVTFARRNSHDLNYFSDPPAIISGKIKPPYVEVNNDKIALRHVNSVVFAWFFRLHEQFFRERVGVFCGYGDGRNALDVLREELAQRPMVLLEAIRTILPPPLYSRMEIDSWGFANRLVSEDGALARAIAERKEELNRLAGIKRACDAEEKPSDKYLRLINTYKDEEVLSFLASSGVLPKYGFPIDVVQLKVLGNSEEAQRIELARDLGVAIGEYAPPSEVVANGRVWTSYALNTVPNKAWPEHAYYECHHCGRISFPDEPANRETGEYPQKDCLCGERLTPKLYVVPIFGFSTTFESKPRMVGESKPKHAHATRVRFREIGDLDSYQQEQRSEASVNLCGKTIHAEYSPNGQMVVLNTGYRGAGLMICTKCGYVSSFPIKEEHKNKFGEKCWNRSLTNLSLGHSFGTDILMLTFPPHFTESDKDRDLSLLYAILEGASIALGIAREDINGCVVSDNKIVLYDVSAGGAGHVRQIFTHLQQVLEAAAQRVSGQCGCSEETSCYGCLRNYGNQFDHEKLGRGIAYEYLSWLLEDSQATILNTKQSHLHGGGVAL